MVKTIPAGWLVLLAAAAGAPFVTAEDSFKPLTTGVLRGGEAPRQISVSVKGLDDLWLQATSGGDDYHHDRAAWGDPVLVDRNGRRMSLTKIQPARVTVGWGSLVLDAGLDRRGPLKIGNTAFRHGLLAHAPSALHFKLDGKYERFEASVGIAAGAGKNGSSRFRVLASYDPKGMEKYPNGRDQNPRRQAAPQRPPPTAVSPKALRFAINDLIKTFPERYPDGQRHLAELEDICRRPNGNEKTEALRMLQRKALLANPLLDFDKLLLVRRTARNLGLPRNWQSNSSLPKTGYNNDIAVLSMAKPDHELQTLFRPQHDVYAGHLDLHFDAGRILLSMPSKAGKGPWHVYEIRSDGSGLRQVSQTKAPGVNNYDACYLPDERILFTSTACMAAVPCVRGNAPVATLFRMNPDGSGMRQLAFDQEHSWHPAVMANGRVLYTRWEYADLPHSNSRMLFLMNPDGTNQRSYYGSNSFWPNSIFYARPVPGHATMVAGIVTGHHAPPRMGEFILFDPALGAREAEGVVQRIPGHREKVQPVIQDGLTANSWPKFLHPFPLSPNYHLVSAQPRGGHWGIYLVDVFDNMLLLREEPGFALLEPVPLRPTPRPPVVPDKIDPSRNDATVFISDVYHGPGLKGIPRGEVEKLRLYTYTFGYNGVGGLYGSIGMDGPWDMRRTLGTVPVEPDGSALFKVPANTPIALQPLDREGKAMQIMRSWFTAMPGENLSCVGCHEDPNDAPPVKTVLAATKTPAAITPWRGPPRNYEFRREVQPVLDRFCVGCHQPPGSGARDDAPHGMVRRDGQLIPDLRGTQMITGWSTRMAGNTGKGTGGKFSVSYANLHRHVRRPGIESPMPLQTPMEFHADTTELVQLLLKGHHNVKLDAEAWDRLVTWIDFNAPYHGRWSTIVGPGAAAKEKQRAELRRLYANLDENHENLPETPGQDLTPVIPEKAAPPAPVPFHSRLDAPRNEKTLEIQLRDGLTMTMVRIPPGRFVMGSSEGYPDEAPMTMVRIPRGFWMGRCEVTNEQFRAFHPSHHSREEDRHGYQFGIPGYDVNQPRMPAVRLSWKQAVAFCDWLTTKTGRQFALPTEAQWEWACRAGAGAPFNYGTFQTDFSKHANLGDAMLADFSGNPYVLDHAKARYNNPRNIFDNWIPQDSRFNDGGFLSVNVASYAPNPWGLHDMHGNVAEWTRSLYIPYPYDENDGRNDRDAHGKRVVRGGSWYDRPKRCTSSYRFGYRTYQKVYNVGFRVIQEDD